MVGLGSLKVRLRQSSKLRPLSDEPGPLRAKWVALRAEWVALRAVFSYYIRIPSIISQSEEGIASPYYSKWDEILCGY